MGSRFYASIEGKARTEATRQGTPDSGIRGHIRGWKVGVRVIGYAGENGKDIFKVYRTGGSNKPGSGELIATISEQE